MKGSSDHLSLNCIQNLYRFGNETQNEPRIESPLLALQEDLVFSKPNGKDFQPAGIHELAVRRFWEEELKANN